MNRPGAMVTRTSCGLVLERFLAASPARGLKVSAASSAAFFSASSCSLPRSTAPLATDCIGVPSNSVQVVERPLVHAVGHQQHLDALLAEDLELRAVLRGGQRVGGDVVDGLLAFLHARLVVGQRNADRVELVLEAKRSSLARRSRLAKSSPRPSLSTGSRTRRRTWRTCPCLSLRVGADSRRFSHAWPGLPACPARAWCCLRGSPSRRGFPAAVRG